MNLQNLINKKEPIPNIISNKNFKPCYVWPNPAFPWRLYFNNENCKIFIIENIIHNYEWLNKYKELLKDNNVYFFVILGCHNTEFLVKHSYESIESLNLNPDKFIILCNDNRDLKMFNKYFINCHIINQNCWLDWDLFKIIPDCQKLFDAIYVGRFIKVKRHYLATKINNLALVSSINNKTGLSIPEYKFLNEKPLSPNEVIEKINQAKCGLILSKEEGACFASSEYLLCGCPVVSTKSEGGRDVWYNEYNSKIVEDNVEAVKSGVDYFLNNPTDPYKIREDHITMSKQHICEFIKILQNIFNENNIQLDASLYFTNNYFHKMRTSQVLKIEDL